MSLNSVEGFLKLMLTPQLQWLLIDGSCTRQFGKTAVVSIKMHSKPLLESHTPNYTCRYIYTSLASELPWPGYGVATCV